MNTTDIIIIVNLILLEALLSVDNAAVLATMVKHLNPIDQQKALKYGLLGAYVFRGLALLLASWLIKIAFLKLLGGLYLIYLSYEFFSKKHDSDDEDEPSVARSFWKTVLFVEIMDMAFSIDNVFAAVAMSPKLWVVITGVFIGILAMRFVAGQFVILMKKYPELETSAYLVILMLGVKLSLGFIAWFFGIHSILEFMEGHTASMITSGITIILFLSPIIKRYVSRP